ncbi:ion channel protein Tsx [Shewanella avicenniae]|uniref:Ion channel protein Tsx n=1 Tax=Shewanella avicenniae TaxID=2814294 RepID=A0ABX7QPF8_9GAMM|nr:outer membrane protein OmpK [Shewanella avicenniae]QSX33362.1 ion channel protein Tsx [Shewanella avicenniae]
MKKTCLCLALLAAAPQAYSEDLVQWTDTSVTVLYGSDYKLDPDEQTTVTVESAGGWKYGDWFAFHDFIHFNNDGAAQSNTSYGEISPRFSASKILGTKVAAGIISDVSLAFTMEHGEGSVETFLYGVGVDVNVPYFSYLQLNTYRRNANNNNSTGWQFTPCYRIDIPVGSSNLVIDGFIDWVFASDEDNYSNNIHFNPQIKYDLGAVIFGEAQKNKLMVGIEYDYWKNKYGVDGINQSTYSAIVKYHF